MLVATVIVLKRRILLPLNLKTWLLNCDCVCSAVVSHQWHKQQKRGEFSLAARINPIEHHFSSHSAAVSNFFSTNQLDLDKASNDHHHHTTASAVIRAEGKGGKERLGGKLSSCSLWQGRTRENENWRERERERERIWVTPGQHQQNQKHGLLKLHLVLCWLGTHQITNRLISNWTHNGSCCCCCWTRLIYCASVVNWRILVCGCYKLRQLNCCRVESFYLSWCVLWCQCLLF